MPKILLLVSLILSQTAIIAQTVNYTESTDIIANPERGLQKYSITDGSYNTTNGYSNLDVNTLISWRTGNDKITVLFRYFLLDNYMTSDISQTYLDNMGNDFEIIRNAGLKCIVRFSYSDAQSAGIQQPVKAQILSHLSQLTSVLEENKDVILTHQAGFIGTWGEWYYTNSNEFGTDGNIDATQWQNRKDVVDAMLQATPLEIPIQVRYADIKTTMYGSVALTPLSAYQNTPSARIGFFNDAFLNNWGDQGTYSVNTAGENPVGTADYVYMANETLYTPMTGETNGLNAPRTDASNAVFEMDSVNWTTLNRDYFETNWDNWIDDGYYDQILKELGYRFVLDSSKVTPITSGFNLTLDLTNTGFARPFKERNVYVVLKNTATNDITTYPITTDIRTWEDAVSISQDFIATHSVPLELYLWMPDTDSGLSTNPAYSIQCANTGTWDAATGYNNLLQTVNVTVGLDEFSVTNEINLYPNPTSNEITLPGYIAEKIKILDSNGGCVKEMAVSNNHIIDVSELSNGVYYIHLNDKKLIYRFVKQ